MEAVRPIEVEILERVDDIEPGEPKEDRQTEKKRHRELIGGGGSPADRQPGAHGGEREGEPEKKVRGPGKSFRQRIKKDDPERHRGQGETERVQPVGGVDKYERGDDRQNRRLPDFDFAPGQLPRARPRIERVEVPVGQAIEAHGRAPRSHHRGENPAEGAGRGRMAWPGEGHRGEREGQGEYGVGKTDQPAVGGNLFGETHSLFRARRSRIAAGGRGQIPSFSQIDSIYFRVFSSIRIGSGHSRSKPSVLSFVVASIPIFDPYPMSGTAWSRPSTGPS